MYKNYFNAARCQIETLIIDAISAAVQSGALTECELPSFDIERPGERKNGDFSANIALKGAKALRTAPPKIAAAILAHISLPSGYFERCEVAGPGFLNFFCNDCFYTDILSSAAFDADYGRTNTGEGKRYNVEFVSANPTGPMHLGNARGGALGESLAALLKTAGYDVTKEFYINDAGNQIAKFGASLSARYMQIFDPSHPFPEDGYKGEDITQLATEFAQLKGDILKNADDRTRSDVLVGFALPKNIDAIKSALLEYRIEFDNFFSEQTLYDSGAVAAAIEAIRASGLAYEQDGTTFFAFSKCGGEKDEVLIRGNGVPTYFAADIAYHLNKLNDRGFERAIDIWGADHHGHIARLKAAITAAGGDGERLDIIMVQLVRLMSGKEVVRMSKRSGKAITLTTLLQEVPLDAARFFFNLREAGTHLDFDLELAVQTNSENPVYYVQYAHARISNMIATLADGGVLLPDGFVPSAQLLTHETERALILRLGALPELIDTAARCYDVSLLSKYLMSIAADFHRFYTECRIKGEPENIAHGRLAIALATKNTIARLLSILCVDAPDKM